MAAVNVYNENYGKACVYLPMLWMVPIDFVKIMVSKSSSNFNGINRSS